MRHLFIDMKESIGGVGENDSDHSDDVVDDFFGRDESSVESEESNRSIESKLKVIVGRWCLRTNQTLSKTNFLPFFRARRIFLPFFRAQLKTNCGGGVEILMIVIEQRFPTWSR